MMEDDGGGDEKVIAVPSGKISARYDRIRTVAELPPITKAQIEHFFQHYKDLEPGKWVKIVNWGDVDDAKRVIREAIERARTAKAEGDA